jgi:CTP:molybdopterin cytidylyltransferase MocA
MTVAACLLAASTESALRKIEGTPNVRRLVDLAWAGGAMPVVVVTPDREGAVAAALAGSPAVVGTPAPEPAGPVGQIARAVDIARAEIPGTDAVLIWPAQFGWVDAETVTSLIEAHGTDRATVLRPAFRGEAGWPALVPVVHLEALGALDAALMPGPLVEALTAAIGGRFVELGDPGTVHDLDTPRAELPPFEAPPEPASAHHHDWGSPAASGPDEPPEPARTVG